MEASSFSRFLLKTSRPRFWLYILGPYLLGIAWSFSTNISLPLQGLLAFYFLYFLFPANLLIYGVNDFADGDTDQFNPKKEKQETRFLVQYTGKMLMIFLGLLFLGLLPMITFPSVLLEGNTVVVAIESLLLFFFTSLGYSLPPIRAKVIPFLDGVFNILYMLPGVYSYVLVTGHLPPSTVMFAGLLWCMAMHAYSAIPDRASDKKASLATVATVCGLYGTLFYCLVLWGAVALLLSGYSYITLVYPLLIIFVLNMQKKHPETLERVYWAFPWINGFVGLYFFFAPFISGLLPWLR